jgi:hypothetical protein
VVRVRILQPVLLRSIAAYNHDGLSAALSIRFCAHACMVVPVLLLLYYVRTTLESTRASWGG